MFVTNKTSSDNSVATTTNSLKCYKEDIASECPAKTHIKEDSIDTNISLSSFTEKKVDNIQNNYIKEATIDTNIPLSGLTEKNVDDHQNNSTDKEIVNREPINFCAEKNSTDIDISSNGCKEYGMDENTDHITVNKIQSPQIVSTGIFYDELCEVLELIKDNTKRIEITDKLSEFFAYVIQKSPDDLAACIYLCLGSIAPAYEGRELGIGEATLLKAISISTGIQIKNLKQETNVIGDLGLIAMAKKTTQTTIFKARRLKIKELFKTLNEIANLEGSKANSKKISLINKLYLSCSPIEAQFLTRFLQKKMRIGLAEKTILRSLAQALDPENLNEAIEKVMSAYNQVPNYNIITDVLIKKGLPALETACNIRPGIPLRPMLSHPANSITEIVNRFESCDILCEFKYDGERVQIHYEKNGNINIFSRNMEMLSGKYPDIVNICSDIPKDGVKSFILDCEAVAWDRENNKSLPFQHLSTRKRTDVTLSSINVNICIFVFDILYLNDKPTIDLLQNERRELIINSINMKKGVIMLTDGIKTRDIDEMEVFFQKSIQSNCEGLIMKCLDDTSTYKPTVRTRNWIKLKKDYVDGTGDTFDLVPIAAYSGHGKRATLYGGFLLAIYNEDTGNFQSICKIGTGFSEKILQELQESLAPHIIDKPKCQYEYENVPSLRPDFWFDAVQVWEVKASDISLSPIHKAGTGLLDPNKGISLRFPRFIRIRTDKDPIDSTTGEQLANMYRAQINREISLNPSFVFDDE